MFVLQGAQKSICTKTCGVGKLVLIETGLNAEKSISLQQCFCIHVHKRGGRKLMYRTQVKASIAFVCTIRKTNQNTLIFWEKVSLTTNICLLLTLPRLVYFFKVVPTQAMVI